ncbi:hypothetical protein ACL7CG_18295 (plasmid) [Bordetella pertussis]
MTDSSRSRQRHIGNLMDHWQPPVDGARLVATLLDREGELPILRCSADDRRRGKHAGHRLVRNARWRADPAGA